MKRVLIRERSGLNANTNNVLVNIYRNICIHKDTNEIDVTEKIVDIIQDYK